MLLRTADLTIPEVVMLSEDAVEDVRCAVASRPDLPSDVQHLLARDTARVSRALAENPGLDEEVQRFLAAHIHGEAHAAFTANPGLSASVLSHLALGESFWSRALSNPSLPVAAMEEAVRCGRKEDLVDLARNPSLPVCLQEVFAGREGLGVVLAANPGIAPSIQEKLLAEGDVSVHVALAENSVLVPFVVERLFALGDRAVVTALASHPNLPRTAVQELLGDPAGAWDGMLALNPSLTEGEQMQLAADRGDSTRRILARHGFLHPSVQGFLSSRHLVSILIALAGNAHLLPSVQETLARIRWDSVKRELAQNPSIDRSAQGILKASSREVREVLLANPSVPWTLSEVLDFTPSIVQEHRGAMYLDALGLADEEASRAFAGNWSLTLRDLLDACRLVQRP